MTELAALGRLWLEEPDRAALEAAEQTAVPPRGVGPSELSEAYSELFLMNVYAYGTVFTDPSAELNAPAARRTALRFSRAGYAPRELDRAGAPDHVGLCLGYLAERDSKGEEDREFLAECAEWIPVCALAVERNPGAHTFYVELARRTREALLERAASLEAVAAKEPEEAAARDESPELSSILRFLLAPARCGLFLSRARLGALAREAGLRIPFGGRYDVARGLFGAAGDADAVDPLLRALEREASIWTDSYVEISGSHPIWKPAANRWLRRLEKTRERLRELRREVAAPMEVEYRLAEDERGRDNGRPTSVA